MHNFTFESGETFDSLTFALPKEFSKLNSIKS
jgi:hypothetical protein